MSTSAAHGEEQMEVGTPSKPVGGNYTQPGKDKMQSTAENLVEALPGGESFKRKAENHMKSEKVRVIDYNTEKHKNAHQMTHPDTSQKHFKTENGGVMKKLHDEKDKKLPKFQNGKMLHQQQQVGDGFDTEKPQKPKKNGVSSNGNHLINPQPAQPEKVRSWRCQLCGKIFHRLDEHQRHILVHEANYLQWSCKHCQRYFASRRSLLGHCEAAEAPLTCKCDWCLSTLKLVGSISEWTKLNCSRVNGRTHPPPPPITSSSSKRRRVEDSVPHNFSVPSQNFSAPSQNFSVSSQNFSTSLVRSSPRHSHSNGHGPVPQQGLSNPWRLPPKELHIDVQSSLPMYTQPTNHINSSHQPNHIPKKMQLNADENIISLSPQSATSIRKFTEDPRKRKADKIAKDEIDPRDSWIQVQKIDNQTRYRCVKCPDYKPRKSKKELQTHVRHHSKDGSGFQCKYCKKGFDNIKKRNGHYTQCHMKTKPKSPTPSPSEEVYSNGSNYSTNTQLISSKSSAFTKPLPLSSPQTQAQLHIQQPQQFMFATGANYVTGTNSATGANYATGANFARDAMYMSSQYRSPSPSAAPGGEYYKSSEMNDTQFLTKVYQAVGDCEDKGLLSAEQTDTLATLIFSGKHTQKFQIVFNGSVPPDPEMRLNKLAKGFKRLLNIPQ